MEIKTEKGTDQYWLSHPHKKSLFLLSLFVIVGCGKNNAPLCSINHPSPDAVIEVGDTIVVSADASDPDGYIDEVRFFINDIGEASVREFPYNYQWLTAGKDPGIYIIKIVAYDDEQVSSSAEISVLLKKPEKDISNNAPPVGAFVTPKTNDSIQQGTRVIMSVEASDPDGDSVEVIFYIDEAGISSDKTYPYAYTWNTDGVSIGEHILVCRIIDEHEAVAHDTVKIMIIEPLSTNIAPTCEVFAPANDASFGLGDTVKIRVNAEDQDGTINEVRFFVNGTGIGSDKEFPYEYDWHTGGLDG